MLSSRAQDFALDAHYYPTKTPSRGLKRAENAGARTVGPKGKAGGVLKTPFGKSTAGKGIFATAGKSRPFLDKTPAPNRVYQQNGKGEGGKDDLGKLPKLVLIQKDARGNATPEIQMPSSTRRNSRLPRSAEKKFQTPMNKGNHWDVVEMSPEVEIDEAEPILEENDYDEIEYMPPNTLDIAHQPSLDFDLPDYKAIAQDFRKVVFSSGFDDIDFHLPDLDELKPEVEKWEYMPLKELDDDDPFRLAQKKLTPMAKATEQLTKPSAPLRRPTAGTVPSRPKIARPASATSDPKVPKPSAATLAVRPTSAAARARAGGPPPVTRSLSATASKSFVPSQPTPASRYVGSRTGVRPTKAAPTKPKATGDDDIVLSISINESIAEDFLFEV